MRISLTLVLLAFLLGSSETVTAQSLSEPAASAVADGDTANINRTAESTASGDWPHGFMAAVANPDATEAAAEMLARGGHAVDAAIAAHAVLGLVEPESSGLGGGGFMLVYSRESGAVTFYDGRETAPAAAGPDLFMRDGEVLGFLQAMESGHAVGVPGAVALYKLLHDRHGKLPWADLFQPAINLASEGFLVTDKLARSLISVARYSRLDENPSTAAYFYPAGQALRAGDLVRNPDYAETLRRIAEEGPAAFYRGPIAEAIVAAAQDEPIGGLMTLTDLADYQPVEREAVCGPWRSYRVCSATPPSSGAMQIMIPNLYDHLVPEDASLAERVRAFVDAQRLAYADRDYYFGDPDRVDVPVEQLINPRYLEYRGINPAAPAATPEQGDPAAVLGMAALAKPGPDATEEAAGTTHLSIIDSEGNAVSATMTVESAFGSKRWAAGFLLNNEMTDFSRDYDPAVAEPANMIRSGARPRSSMSPTFVLDAADELFLVTGSPGGNSIPAYTAKTVLGIVDWGLSVSAAIAFPNIIARGETVRVETGMEPGAELAERLREAGYNVSESEGENSGLHVILVGEDGLVGAADPRREGTVMNSAPLR